MILLCAGYRWRGPWGGGAADLNRKPGRRGQVWHRRHQDHAAAPSLQDELRLGALALLRLATYSLSGRQERLIQSSITRGALHYGRPYAALFIFNLWKVYSNETSHQQIHVRYTAPKNTCDFLVDWVIDHPLSWRLVILVKSIIFSVYYYSFTHVRTVYRQV